MNALVLDLTSDMHFITLQYDGQSYEFLFKEEQDISNDFDRGYLVIHSEYAPKPIR